MFYLAGFLIVSACCPKMLFFILLLINSALMFKIDYTFSQGKLPYICCAPLFLWRSPKSAEELFYQWLPQMCAAPLNLFLKESHRKWLFSHPKHEQNGLGKKL